MGGFDLMMTHQVFKNSLHGGTSKDILNNNCRSSWILSAVIKSNLTAAAPVPTHLVILAALAVSVECEKLL